MARAAQGAGLRSTRNSFHTMTDVDDRIADKREMELAQAKYDNWQRRLAHALETGDFSLITTSSERCYLTFRLARNQDWQRAEQVARSILDDPDDHGQALAALAEQLANAGHPDRALQLAAEIPVDPVASGAHHEKVVAYLAVARSFVRVGRTNDAVSALTAAVDATTILEPHTLWQAADFFLGASRIYRGIGLPTEARKCIDAVFRAARADVDSEKIKAAACLELAELGDIEAAREAIDQIAQPYFRARTLLRLRTEYPRHQ